MKLYVGEWVASWEGRGRIDGVIRQGLQLFECGQAPVFLATDGLFRSDTGGTFPYRHGSRRDYLPDQPRLIIQRPLIIHGLEHGESRVFRRSRFSGAGS